MKEKIPLPAIVGIVVVVVVIIGFLGFKAFSNSGGDGEGKPTIIQVDKNDPKFQSKLPAGMSGGQ